MTDSQIRRDRLALVNMLTQWGAKFHGNSCTCPMPGHDDRRPSAGVYAGVDDVWRFKCQHCDNKPMDIFDVEAAMRGVNVADVLRENSGSSAGNNHSNSKSKSVPTYATIESAERNDYSIVGFSAKYRYSDTLYVYRIDKHGGGKRFCQLHQRSDGAWVPRKPEGVLPLYAPIPLGYGKVVFVEGEKCVDILAGLGVPAITTMGGASASKRGEFDWSPVSGKTVFVWPDNDADGTGEQHSERVCAMIEAAGGTVKVVDVNALGIPVKGDVEQYLADAETRAEKMAKLRVAFTTLKQPAPVKTEIEVVETSVQDDMLKIVEREYRGEGLPIPWPWREFNRSTQFSTPGTVSMIIAPPASSKSFAIIEAASLWCDNDIPFALYELEDRSSMHSFRALAQRMREPGLTRPEWRAANASAVRKAIGEHSEFLNKLNRQMYGQTTECPTKDGLLDWMRKRAQEKPRIIIIDPITARKSGRDQWLDDEGFVDGIKRIVDENPDINITLVSHPKKGAAEPHLDNIAGGASFGRLLHKVVWIQSSYPSTKSVVRDTMCTVEREHNRTWHALKLRDMPGTGLRIAMDFCANDLCFHERGLIISKEEKKKEGSIHAFRQRAIDNGRRSQSVAPAIEKTYEEDEDAVF